MADEPIADQLPADDHTIPFADLTPDERLFRMRHSAAHVLAEAVLELFPTWSPGRSACASP
jgi:threonyl-tRNA synthetase